jgi:uncharacterized protein (UPF0147 family)
MKKKIEKQIDMGTSAPKPTTLDLRGRQSVRATFRLSEECIDAISILSAQLGIKQKSVFDHLMEDAQVLKNIARKLEDTEFNRQERIQKTFVLSRRSLSFLDMISNTHNAPRDALVEYSVYRLLPVIINEREKHEQRKEILAEISNHFKTGERLLSKTAEMLGTDDPIVNKLKAVMSVYKNVVDGISSFIEKGKLIEEFQPGQMGNFLSSSKEADG